MSEKPSLIGQKLNIRPKKYFPREHLITVSQLRYGFLIFSGFVHSKFGCRANTFFVHFTWSDMWSHASTSHLQSYPQGATG